MSISCHEIYLILLTVPFGVRSLQRRLTETFDETTEEKIFWVNVDSCTSALVNKFSSLDESSKTVSGRAELLASICVCAEQTFVQASATKLNFDQAFSIALNAYVKSTVRDEANEAIKVLLEGGDRLDTFKLSKQLGNIVKNHRLRINANTV